MKVATYGALMGALLAISAVDAANADDCSMVCRAPHKVVHRAPAHAIHHSSGASYAQSFYDYRSSSRVGEVFVRNAPPPMAYADDGFRVAPNDAHFRFVREEKVVYVPVAAYPAPYPPPPAYYPQPVPGISLDDRQFNIGGGGGVGYGAEYNGGGGNGGGFIYSGQTSQDVPPNGGGVNLPAGYGPSYNSAWQGGRAPTRGGLVTSTPNTTTK